jgi:acyl carrier protein
MAYETEVIETISSYLNHVKKKEQEITLESKLVDVDVDSLDIIEITFLLEEKFGIYIEVDDLMKFNAESVGDIVKFIEEHAQNNK